MDLVIKKFGTVIPKDTDIVSVSVDEGIDTAADLVLALKYVSTPEKKLFSSYEERKKIDHDFYTSLLNKVDGVEITGFLTGKFIDIVYKGTKATLKL